jgi:TRAP-type C4-dicarboxylate transport system permease small subunit
MRPLILANRLQSGLEAVLICITAVIMFLLMLLIVVDVGMRYTLNSPLGWSYDLIGMYIIPCIFFLALADTFRRNDHVAVDILYLKAPVGLRRGLRLVTALVGVAIFGVILVTAWQNTVEKYLGGDVIDGAVLWPTWISSSLVVLGAGAILLRLLLDALALLRALIAGGPHVPGESPVRDVVGADPIC